MFLSSKFVTTSLLIVWVGLSASQWILGDPSAFQRLGSLGVAVGIIAFSILYRDLSALDIKAALLKVDAASLLTELDQIEKDVAKLPDQGSDSEVALRKEQLTQLRDAISVSQDSIARMNEKAQKVRSDLASTELLYLVLATLQWGYGDLFHCWANGNGWQVCY